MWTVHQEDAYVGALLRCASETWIGTVVTRGAEKKNSARKGLAPCHSCAWPRLLHGHWHLGCFAQILPSQQRWWTGLPTLCLTLWKQVPSLACFSPSTAQARYSTNEGSKGGREEKTEESVCVFLHLFLEVPPLLLIPFILCTGHILVILSLQCSRTHYSLLGPLKPVYCFYSFIKLLGERVHTCNPSI